MDTFVILIAVACVAVAIIIVIGVFITFQQRQSYFLCCFKFLNF